MVHILDQVDLAPDLINEDFMHMLCTNTKRHDMTTTMMMQMKMMLISDDDEDKVDAGIFMQIGSIS